MKKEALTAVAGQLGIKTDTTYEGRLRASCPFAPFYHTRKQDVHPSFVMFITEDKPSWYYCSACGEQGNISSLVRKLGSLRNVNYSKLIVDVELAEVDMLHTFKAWGETYVVEDPPIEILDESIYDIAYKKVGLYRDAMLYLESRRISSTTAELLDLRYDEYQKRVLFPVRTKEGLCGFSGRAINDNIQPKVRDYLGLPKKRIIMGQHKWQGKPVILVEGLFAYARMHEHGMHNNYDIGAMLGAKLTDHKADLVKEAGRTTYLLLDGDDAGEVGIFGRDGKGGAVDKLYHHVPLVIPAYPAGKDDPDDLTLDELKYMLEKTPIFIL